MPEGISFQELGIGAVLDQFVLAVPLNQRPYAWEREHVTDLYADLENAIANPAEPYFLGTMVLTRVGDDRLAVADGQQRLATCVILLAAIRDHLVADGDSNDQLVIDITSRYLNSYDMHADDIVPKLSLNVEDNEFFRNTVLMPPATDTRSMGATKPSHNKIKLACEIARRQVRKIVDTPRASDQLARIKQWLDFIRKRAQVITVVVADEGKAFTIFETLNDRGLRLSQVDLLKNYLYGLANQAGRLPEAAERWDSMVGAIEATGYEELSLDYIRHLWISYYGHVREGDLYDRIKEKVKTPAKAIEFAGLLQDNASRYIALLNPTHPYWNGYTDKTRKCVEIMTRHLRVDRIRPLMLAIARKLPPKDVESSFELCISWTVRFLVVGGIGSGTVEKWYAEQAQGITDGAIPGPSQLAKAMMGVAPRDEAFEKAFEKATVSRNYIARYYLRALEEQHRGEDAILIPDDDSESVNLEHVLPENPGEDWDFDAEGVRPLFKRIGNMALLDKKSNSDLKSDSFEKKKAVYSGCPIELTARIATYGDWGEESIDDRQRQLAELAVKTWPLIVNVVALSRT